MIRRASILSKWALASLLTGLVLTASVADAKPPAYWSKTNRTRYTNARATQYRSQQKAQLYNLRARKQYAYYKKHGNSKQLSWARNNRVRAARSKVRAMNAKARRLESLAVVAGKMGNKSRAAALRSQATKIKGRVNRLNSAIERFVSHHGLNTQASKFARENNKSTTTSASTALTTTTSTSAVRTSKYTAEQRSLKRSIAREYNTQRKAYESGMAKYKELKAQGLGKEAAAQRVIAGRAQVKMLQAQARGLRAKAERNPARASAMKDRADKLDRQATSRERVLSRYERMYVTRQTGGAVTGASSEVAPSVDTGSQGSSAAPGNTKIDAYRQTYESKMQKFVELEKQAYETGDASLLRSAVAHRVVAERAQVKAWKAEAQNLRAEAQKEPSKAAENNALADKLDRRASLRDRALRRYTRIYNSAIPKQVADTEAVPGVDAAAPQIKPVGSREGYKTAKAQLSYGNLTGAVSTLKAMEAKKSRSWLNPLGVMDRFRKWNMRRKIRKVAYKAGKQGAKTSDFELAQEALAAIEATSKEGFLHNWSTKRKFRGIAHAALTGAKRAAKSHRAFDAYQLQDFAKQIMEVHKVRPTIRYRIRRRLIRRTAKSRVWKDAKRFAKEGNMEAFRVSMKLASAYRREDGKPVTKRSVRKARDLYNTALKRSVVRALDDAQLLISGQMGYVSVEEAAKRLAYAQQTADALAHKGVHIRTGLFRRSIGGKLRSVRKQVVEAWGNQPGNHRYAVKPGLLKRMFNAWFKQAHRRRPPPIAPVDSRWERKMAERQQQQAAMEQGMTPEMMAQLQAQMAAAEQGQQDPQPGQRKVTPQMVREGINE